ncbi:MAG: tRNA preQ1(34) S-adenosylmethionine ribosyltransferase-isomerase QueA [Deltaproteobacteria bacterium]|nr:tRNA preQ1(34) S-adenosylmethionine ribosyltransferase-isomerase QueA [Deltaproteobacteria bacterium]
MALLRDFSFFLPESLIAQHPLPQRDGSRLLAVTRRIRGQTHHRFADLPELLPEGCLLVFNNTRVIPARLLGRLETGRTIEALLSARIMDSPPTWRVMIKGARRVKPGMELEFAGGALTATALYREREPAHGGGQGAENNSPGDEKGDWVIRFHQEEDFAVRLNTYGLPPLPPYIRREEDDSRLPEDRERYQTVFSKQEGAIAAPTAGLHFTPALLDELSRRGMERVELTLHVGLGTFQPIREEDPALHIMHKEWYAIPGATADAVDSARRAGRPVIAVGTTVARALENWAALGWPGLTGGEDRPEGEGYAGTTDIFIRPPYDFRAVDGLITNFHLPCSTLLMLVAAFHGLENTLNAYNTAVEQQYRFFSYGDAMVILP